MSLKGFEPPTHGLEGRCSIQLSYRLIMLFRKSKAGDGNRTHVSSLEGWCSTIATPAGKLCFIFADLNIISHIRSSVNNFFIFFSIKIGVTGFEPATPWSQTRCSSQAEPHPGISAKHLKSKSSLNAFKIIP